MLICTFQCFLGFSVAGTFFHGYFFAFHLLNIINTNQFLQRVLQAVTQHGKVVSFQLVSAKTNMFMILKVILLIKWRLESCKHFILFPGLLKWHLFFFISLYIPFWCTLRLSDLIESPNSCPFEVQNYRPSVIQSIMLCYTLKHEVIFLIVFFLFTEL